MKKVILLVLLLSSSCFAFAQTPQKFSYQAVAVDATGAELRNQEICLRASIISSTFNGIEEWVEVHPDVVTDDFGLFTIEVGNGQPVAGAQDAFADIPWGNSLFFLKMEMALNSQCTDFILVGTNQLLSVPYALYAEKAGHANTADVAIYADSAGVANYATQAGNALYADTTSVAMVSATALDDADTDPTNEIQELELNGNALSLSGGITSIDLTLLDPDRDSTNELQNLEVNGSMLTLSNSTAPPIDLNAGDNDTDPVNELQELELNGNALSLTGGSTSIDLTVLDPDRDSTNELQNLEVVGSMLTLSGSTAPPIDLNSGDGDTDPLNELQELELNGNSLSLSGGSTSIDLTMLDPDRDSTNELQNLEVSGSMLTLSNSTAPPIDLNAGDGDTDPGNELQELTFDDDTNLLGLSNSANAIDLSVLSAYAASGADFDFPQGVRVANAGFKFFPNMLTVPFDSVFYVVACEDEMILPGYGNNFGRHLTGPNLPMLKSGTSVQNCRCIGFFKPNDPFFEAVIEVLDANQGNAYTVPIGKNLIIKSGLDETTPLTLNGFTVNPFSSLLKALAVPEGVEVKNLGNDEVILTGYLIDK